MDTRLFEITPHGRNLSFPSFESHRSGWFSGFRLNLWRVGGQHRPQTGNNNHFTATRAASSMLHVTWTFNPQGSEIFSSVLVNLPDQHVLCDFCIPAQSDASVRPRQKRPLSFSCSSPSSSTPDHLSLLHHLFAVNEKNSFHPRLWAHTGRCAVRWWRCTGSLQDHVRC